MKRTIYLISLIVSFLVSFLCISAAMTGISSGANIGSVLILIVLCVLFLVLGIFLCKKYRKQEKHNNSEYNLKVKEYHENHRRLNWFSWQVFILPIGIVLSILSICSNLITASMNM